MPKLIRLYCISTLIGFGVAALFTGILLLFDIAGLRHLLLDTGHATLATLMVFGFSGTLFSGVQFALAVTALADTPPDPAPRRFPKE